ncbi:MAG: cytochrome c family protein [Alphaproteobacteria bacterium]
MGQITRGALIFFGLAAFTASSALALQSGDVKRGEDIYARCMACHSLEYNRTSPKHCGLFGREAGSLPDFDYSEAMKKSGITWSAATLDQFLKKPQAMVPGTIMTYDGVPDDQERADLIAYLEMANAAKEVCP